MGEANKLRPDVNQNSNITVDANANIADDSAIRLKELINLPYEPTEDSPWKEMPIGNQMADNRVPGPTDRKLTAVLKFSKEDTQRIVESAEKKGKSFEKSIESESWFPAELIANSQTTGDNTIKGVAYGVEDFVKPPYSVGTLIRVNNSEYFVLTLQTKKD
ncbi:MAG: hypothetical protein HKN25_09390 [Pyrinomonadaceae bacterium]|nr:hypothetical protein [Pyrinomonadaceae bacterium]